MKNMLSIVIPTYNRAEILKQNLLFVYDEIKLYDVKVYISDDSTDDNTHKMFIKHFGNDFNFTYHKNTPSLGHDKNCIKTLHLGDEEYKWYIGDAMVIKKGSIKRLYDIIKSKQYSFICINSEGRIKPLPESKLYEKDKDVLQEIAWHLTMTGATIYHKDTLNGINIDVSNYKNFPQLAIIFLNFHHKNRINLYWCNEKLILPNINKKSYWAGNLIIVFVDDLKNTLLKLPNKFNLQLVDGVVKQHMQKTGVLEYKELLRMRGKNLYNLKYFRNNLKTLKAYTGNITVIMFVISIIPKKIINILFWLKSRTNNSTS